jgi:TRAP transporter TAXI family solute receptor
VRRRHALLGGLAALGAVGLGVSGLVSASRARAVDALTELRIGTGPPGGVFREIGAALAAAVASRLPGTQIRCIGTDASLQNLQLLDSSGVELAFAAVDAVTDRFDLDVTAVARLFDSWMQVFVPVDSPITSLAQLNGRRVAAGAAGSGTRFTTERLLAVASLKPVLITATQDDGAAQLAAGTVDAWFTCTGVPTPAVRTLANRFRLRLLPLTPYLDDMTSRFGAAYNVATLPSTTYQGVQGTPTITTPNLLLARPEVPAEVVEAVLSGLFSELPTIARDHPEANEINIRSGPATMPVPLHPGALRYFRSQKPFV